MKKMKIKFSLKWLIRLRTLSPIIALTFIIAIVGVFGIVHKKSEPEKLPPPPKIVTKAADYSDFHLLIPSLNINAPIIADVNGSSKTVYFKALENGVAHFAGTAKPGENSNIFIFGHSSYYTWTAGNYKEIFKNLPDINIDDEVDIWYQKKEYKYKVTKTKVVEPTDVDVLKPTSSEQLTLMTCVPVGTNKQRLIVIAKPI